MTQDAPKITVRFPGAGGRQEAQQPDQQSGNNAAGPVIYMANVLHNEDIMQMSQAKLGADVMIRLIRNSAHSFRVEPRSLIELKKEGTPDDVIREMIEVTASYGPAVAQAQPAQRRQQPVEAGEPVETGYMSPGPNGLYGAGQRGISVAFGSRTSSLR